MVLSDSQNYINNKQLVHKLLEFVDFDLTKTILEVGPGKGIITDALVKKQHKKIIAIETDPKLFSKLQKKYVDVINLLLIQADFLKYTMPNKPFIIVSNIPFNITANIVRKITAEQSKMRAAYLIMQKEAAIKFIGAPHAHSPLLSHILNINFKIKLLIDIDKSNYSPRPNFNTAFVSIKKRKKPIFTGKQELLFKDLLTYSFERRQVELGKALKQVMSSLQVKVMCKELGIEKEKSIKKIVFEDWVKIFNIFNEHTPSSSKRKVRGKYDKLLEEQNNLIKRNRTRKDV